MPRNGFIGKLAHSEEQIIVLLADETYAEAQTGFISRVKDYAGLMKLRLSMLVVVSAVTGYLFAPGAIDWISLLVLIVGGFLVTGSSNGINQVIERELDRKMDRTSSRPLPSGRLSVQNSLIFCIASGVLGIFLLYYFLNPLSGILGSLALFIYTVIYTPLKRITPFAVFVGAFPGSIPPMLGWVAVTGEFGLIPGVLFAIQFMWQFPHFWSLAWVLDEDYKKAGFRLLPSGERDKSSAFQTVVYSIFLIPISLLLWMFGQVGLIYVSIASIMGVLILIKAINLFRTLDDAEAKKLMFMSFAYLPIVQIAYVIDKV